MSADEALVLFEWVHPSEEKGLLPQVTEDAAEVIALNALSSLLERELVEPFRDEYVALVQAARRRLIG